MNQQPKLKARMCNKRQERENSDPNRFQTRENMHGFASDHLLK